MDYRERRKSRRYAILYVLITLIIIGGAIWLLLPRFQADAQARRAAAQTSQITSSGDETSSVTAETSIEVPQEIQQPQQPVQPEVAAPAEPEIKEAGEPVAPEEPEPVVVPAPEPVVEPEPEPETVVEPEPEITEVVQTEQAAEQSVIRIPGPPTVIQSYIEEAFDWSSDATSDDFFSDFFVSGSDMVYEDGIQNPYLYINDEYYGSIEVDMRSNAPYISSKVLGTMLLSMLEKSFYDTLFSSGEDYLSLDYLTQMGVVNSFDANSFAIYLSFTAAQMPESSISLSAGNVTLNRVDSIEGVEDIEPAGFSLAANLSAYGYLRYNKDRITGKMAQLSMSGMMSFADLATDFSLSAGNTGVSFGSFQSYFDFIDDNIRLTLGTVPVHSALESSNPLGFSIEKNYAYGTGTRLGNQFQQQIVIEEPCTVVVFMNGVETFRRKMKVGQYKLRDFAFVQGSNQIEIWQVPDSVDSSSLDYYNPDPSITITYFDMGFDTSLLARGENLWKFTYSFPSVKDSGTLPGFHYIDFNGDRMVAKFSDFSASWEQGLGITHTFTLYNVTALSGMRYENGSYSLRLLDSVNLIKAFNYGTLTFNGQVQFLNIPMGAAFDWGSNFNYSMSISNKFNSAALAPIALSIAYDSDSERLSLSTGYSKGFSVFRAAVSGTFGYQFDVQKFTWSAALSLSASFKQGLALSAGINTSSSIITEDIPFNVSVGLSMSLGSSGSVSAKSNLDTIDAGLSFRPFGSKKSSIQVNASGIDVADLLDHTLAMSYSYSGSLVGLSLRQQFTSRYTNYTTTMSLNTAIAFADGHFGMARNISGSYLMVHPTGLMKKSDISIGKATAASSTQYPKIFGNVLYSGLSLYQHNGIVVFGSDSSMFGTGGTFLIGITPRPRQGFVKTITITPTVTISAILRKASGEPYVQYSSPVYKVETKTDAEGNEVKTLVLTADYLFTDDDGRFIQSNLEPGMYCIDLDATPDGSSEKVWYGLFFEVPELDEQSQVIILEDYQVDDSSIESIDIASDLYVKSVLVKEVAREDEQSFWDTIFSADAMTDTWADYTVDTAEVQDSIKDGLSNSENEIEYTPQESVAP